MYSLVSPSCATEFNLTLCYGHHDVAQVNAIYCGTYY